VHFKWKTVLFIIQKNFSFLALDKLALFRSAKNADALQHLAVVLGCYLLDVFRFRKSPAFNTIYLIHVLNAFIK